LGFGFGFVTWFLWVFGFGFGFGDWFFWIFGSSFMSMDSNLDPKKTSTKPKPKPQNQKIFGFKKKSEKIYSLKYLNINKIFLKPKKI